MADDNGNPQSIPVEEYERLTAENESRKGEDGFKLHKLSQGNIFPTVKPIELMRYLVKMVKMPGDNLILDPFCGSGTTAIGCILEGCDFTTIEKDPMSAKIADARIRYFKCLGKQGLK